MNAEKPFKKGRGRNATGRIGLRCSNFQSSTIPMNSAAIAGEPISMEYDQRPAGGSQVMAATFRALFISYILLSSFAARVAASPLDDATAAMDRRDYATALRLLRPLADQGDADAQARLAAMFIAGQGVPQDYAEAAKWFRKATDQGSDMAQLGVAAMYIAGRGVPQDHTEAVRWLRRAADQGDTIAQCLLGHAYATGQGVPHDDVDAVKWPRKAADQGNADTQYGRGLLYFKGLGVPQNNAIARMWPNLGATGGNEEAANYRDALTAKMAPTQIAEAQKLAREWKPAQR
jgi:uncharacterized protein